jgi:hypothetical protein
VRLFENAVSSIQIGLKDYWRDDRLVSSVRNLYAGILLLFKHKLFTLSAENSNSALIKQNVIPTLDSNGAIIWKGVGNKTVDVIGIKNRFQSLGIEVDWKTFERISKYRNEIEHFYSEIPTNDVAELLADCFIIISRFLSDNLNLDVKTVLGEESWEVLLHAYEVYELEINKSERAMNAQLFHHEIIKEIFLKFRCIDCSSPLIHPHFPNRHAESSTYYCAECKSVYSYDDICNMGILDLFKQEFDTGYGHSCSFENCIRCEQGLYLKELRCCTSCGSTN